MRDIFILKKQRTLRYIAIYKEPDTMRYILIFKKTLFFMFIYIIYRVVLIPNYKRTYEQSDQIEKISSSSLLRIGSIPMINKEFSLHTRE